ncbi:MAG: beta-lactamase family protein, partial [Caldilineaceae bacterium]|nr:beta-lactamase family protein [Caldilineaceae bacterium]
MLRANKFLTFLVLVALLASACQPIMTPESMEIGMAGSTELDAALADETVAAIRQIVEERMAQVQAPGFAVAVVRDGTMVYAEGFGVAELGTARPVTPQTVFQLASTSKPITAIAI